MAIINSTYSRTFVMVRLSFKQFDSWTRNSIENCFDSRTEIRFMNRNWNMDYWGCRSQSDWIKKRSKSDGIDFSERKAHISVNVNEIHRIWDSCKQNCWIHRFLHFSSFFFFYIFFSLSFSWAWNTYTYDNSDPGADEYFVFYDLNRMSNLVS